MTDTPTEQPTLTDTVAAMAPPKTEGVALVELAPSPEPAVADAIPKNAPLSTVVTSALVALAVSGGSAIVNRQPASEGLMLVTPVSAPAGVALEPSKTAATVVLSDQNKKDIAEAQPKEDPVLEDLLGLVEVVDSVLKEYETQAKSDGLTRAQANVYLALRGAVDNVKADRK